MHLLTLLHRKKKDKKGESSSAKGLAKAGSAVSLQSRVVTAPRVPQHSYSMSSLKRCLFSSVLVRAEH